MQTASTGGAAHRADRSTGSFAGAARAGCPTGKAFAAGVTGALAMTAVMALLRLVGFQVNLEMMLGSMITLGLGPGTWLIGFLMHLVIGGVFGIVYAGIFRVTRRVDAGVGATIGLAHGFISGILLGFIPAIHLLVPQTIPAPGMMMSGLGLFGVIVFMLEHVMFGAIVGGYLAPSTAPTYTRRFHPNP